VTIFLRLESDSSETDYGTSAKGSGYFGHASAK
jgi:hypothetical protein